MNRPSLYGAFGDKRELYIKSYQRYRDDARAAMIDIFRDELDPQAAGADLRGGQLGKLLNFFIVVEGVGDHGWSDRPG